MPKSKSKRKGISKERAGAAERAQRAAFEKKRQQHNEHYTLIKLRNALPLGHELHAGKIDSVFVPLETAFAEGRDTGAFHVDERGKPCVFDTVDNEWKDLCEATSNLLWVFALLCHQMKWPDELPQGLGQLVRRMDYGMPVFTADFGPAFETLAWMRAKITTVTPNQWSEAWELAQRIEQEKHLHKEAA